jgi:hypothetical protein
MNVEQYLHCVGISESAIVQVIDSVVGFEDSDHLLVVGSLAEGLGNTKSDLDLLLITARASAHAGSNAPDHITAVINSCVIDVTVIRPDSVAALLDRLTAWSAQPWSVSHEAHFTLDERIMLHRLAHAHVLRSGAGLGSASFCPSTAHLCKLKLHVARQSARTLQVDLVGYREDRDYASLVFSSNELLGDAADALLAGYGFSNATTKWRTRLLRLLPAEWEMALPGRPIGLPAADLYWMLHRIPETATSFECVQHALSITTLARRIFSWAERRVLHEEPWLPPVSAAWTEDSAELQSLPLPALDLDVDYQWGDGTVTMGRLNGGRKTVTMTDGAFALCLLFDGRTRLAENGAAMAAIREQLTGADLFGSVDAGARLRLSRDGLSCPDESR